MRKRREPARPWQFWRRAFWTRPALLIAYGVVLGAGGMLVLATVPGEIDDARSMASAQECPPASVRPNIHVGAPSGCLERIEVLLDGPHYSRGPGSEWWLRIDGRIYDDVELSTAASKRLRDNDTAGVLLWEGKPVIIEPSTGERVVTTEWGHAGWLIWLYLGMGLLSGLPFLVDAGKLKRESADGWWAVNGGSGTRFGEFTGLTLVGSLLAAPALLGIFPVGLGDSVLWSVVAAMGGVLLVVAARLVQHRRGTGLRRGSGAGVDGSTMGG